MIIEGFKDDELPLEVNGKIFKYVCPWCGEDLRICKEKMAKNYMKMYINSNVRGDKNEI